jgi:ATP-dependent Clp protease ATP-binding subunit ClpB
VLLQLLDEGRLTDGQGHTVDFRNTLLILTSNLGSRYTDEPEDEMAKKMQEALRQSFRPEFLNRIDDVLVFHRLGKEQLEEIAGIQFRLLEARLAERGIGIRLTDAARKTLAERGYDPAFGARPLKRLIQKEIQNPLAKRILAGEFGDGDQLEVDAHEGAFTFRKA